MKPQKLSGVLGLALLAVQAITPIAQAKTPEQGGGSADVGGGGDYREPRVDEIRGDLVKWLSSEGGRDLELPEGLTYDQYRERMLPWLEPGAVIVTFVTTKQEEETDDPELKVIVNGFYKTCRTFRSEKDNLIHMLCNTERFNQASESGQYRLIHHEYAVLAKVEKNKGAKSDYFVSDQITDYLRKELVLRLAVKKATDLTVPARRSFIAEGSVGGKEPAILKCTRAAVRARRNALNECRESYLKCKYQPKLSRVTRNSWWGLSHSCTFRAVYEGSNPDPLAE